MNLTFTSVRVESPEDADFGLRDDDESEIHQMFRDSGAAVDCMEEIGIVCGPSVGGCRVAITVRAVPGDERLGIVKQAIFSLGEVRNVLHREPFVGQCDEELCGRSHGYLMK